MAEETQYTANTGYATISTANSNLDGTGTMGTVLTAAANGTLVKTITVMGANSTTQGMVRLFIYDGTNTRLFKEIEIPAVTASNIDPRFELHLPLDFALKSGYLLKVSTENAESFNITAEGLDWAYYASSVRSDTTQYTANTGIGHLTTAGAAVGIFQAAANGSSIESITIKAEESPSDGLIDIYVSDGGGITGALYTQIKVTAVTRSGIASSYEYTHVFENDFELKSGYVLVAGTRQNQVFNVFTEALDWAYPA